MKKIIGLFFFFITTCSFGQSQNEVIDSLFYGQKGIKIKYPDVGIVVGIYKNGIVNYYSLGTRVKNGTELLDSTTIFEVGSATKTFTALLLANEISNKKIDRNSYIDKYLVNKIKLPPALKDKVKLTDLASHQSGLPNLSNDKYFDDLLNKDSINPFRFVDKKYLMNVLKETDILNNYGHYQYNNYAFSLLGYILEIKNKLAYESLIKKDILIPLKMNQTSFSVPKVSNVAGLYNQQGEQMNYLILKSVNPAGGLKSNAVDLINYMKAFILPNKFDKAIALTQQVFYDDKNRKVGLGWDIKNDYYQKDGDTFGNSCLMRYNTSKKIAIVVLSNHQNGQLVSDAVDFIYERINN
ncbi:MAG: class A beta-lactamase-related serine hydrolase [Bacteroidetes bacterium]|nr:MAG: class A beta-lactamase-related serine hydrolase [Bacteroidota bacterium]